MNMNNELMKEMLVEVMTQEFYNEAFVNRANHHKAPMVFWSGGSVGKTEAVNRAGMQVGALVANVRLSQITVEDLYIPEVTQIAEKRVYKKVLSDLVPTYRYVNGQKVKAKYAVNVNGQWEVREFQDQYQIDYDLLHGYITEESYEAGLKFAQERGLEIYDLPLVYFLDELNRFTSKPLGQAFFEWLESNALLGAKTPKRIMKIGACNPGQTGDKDVKYQVNDFFKDYAAHSRAIHFKVEADHTAILRYMAAEGSGYLPEEIKFYETYPEELEQTMIKLNDFEIPKTLVEGRKIKYASNYLFHMNWKNQNAKIAMAKGIFGDSMAGKFFSFLESGADRIPTEDIMYKYENYVLGLKPFEKVNINGIETVKAGPTLLDSFNNKQTTNATRKAILAIVERGENEELASYVDSVTNAIKSMDVAQFEEYFKDNQLKLTRFVADINVALRQKLFIGLPTEFIPVIQKLNAGFLEVLNNANNASESEFENNMEVVLEEVDYSIQNQAIEQTEGTPLNVAVATVEQKAYPAYETNTDEATGQTLVTSQTMTQQGSEAIGGLFDKGFAEEGQVENEIAPNLEQLNLQTEATEEVTVVVQPVTVTPPTIQPVNVQADTNVATEQQQAMDTQVTANVTAEQQQAMAETAPTVQAIQINPVNVEQPQVVVNSPAPINPIVIQPVTTPVATNVATEQQQAMNTQTVAEQQQAEAETAPTVQAIQINPVSAEQPQVVVNSPAPINPIVIQPVTTPVATNVATEQKQAMNTQATASVTAEQQQAMAETAPTVQAIQINPVNAEQPQAVVNSPAPINPIVIQPVTTSVATNVATEQQQAMDEAAPTVQAIQVNPVNAEQPQVVVNGPAPVMEQINLQAVTEQVKPVVQTVTNATPVNQVATTNTGIKQQQLVNGTNPNVEQVNLQVANTEQVKPVVQVTPIKGETPQPGVTITDDQIIIQTDDSEEELF